MKLSSIFNLVTDAQDVVDLFDGVTNVDQLRGRLRRLSQIEADDLLTCLQALQTSVARALDDTLEMNPDLDDGELGSDSPVDAALENLDAPETEDSIPDPDPAGKE